MTVIERLNTKKNEFQNQHDSLAYSSVPKSILKKKIEILDELIAAYHSTASLASLSETEKILNQQIGFEEPKQQVLNSLKIKNYCEQNDFQRSPLVLFLVGSPGVGKTTLAQILAQALKKEFFMVALGGMSDSSLLLGNNESYLGTNGVGQLTKALIETKTHDPLILLDEFDKVSAYKGNSAIHNCLNAVLDPVQNKEILDYYLDVKLDFSHITFIITVNDRSEIPKHLLSRMPAVVELPGYTLEQKKEIAQQFIKNFFAGKESLKTKFEITSQALEVLINKTKEKGVRQLKKGLDTEEFGQGKPESKITIDSEVANLRGEKNNQTELKVVRFNSLLVLRQVRGQFAEKEYQDYEGKINTATSREEIEVIVKEFLLKVKQKNISSKPTRENGNKGIQAELAKIKDLNKILEGKLKLFDDELKKLKGATKTSRGQGNEVKTLLIIAVIIATLKKYFNNPNLAPARNLVNCQRVIRTDDLANINAHSYHQTLFEMLGDFSIDMGDGPCGANTEIYFDFHSESGLPKKIEDLDNKRFIEICNIVFPEFYHQGEKYLPLAEKCVDTGAGLERITMVLQGKKNTFQIDL
ncbi:20285_t:CDS:2 [Funneliformis geosporum]|nr:20285_t:CDS:2 [Funneliformis geosporum]